MSSRRQAYSSTVTSPGSTAAGVILAVAVAAFVAWLAGPLLAVACAVPVALCAVYVSTVRLVVGHDRLVVGPGPWGWPARVISFDDIVDIGAEELGLGQALGVGLGPFWRRTRLTVRPGAALDLVLRSGEHLVISTARPEQAARLITDARATRTVPTPTTLEAPMSEPASEPTSERRPWFGPKRIGYGIGPQTWQGWAIVVAVVVAIVVGVRLL